MTNDTDLLGQFTREPATRPGQDAFTALVDRHLNLVYSAALRQVRSPQLAEEISQSVFTQLANHAASLKPGTVLAAWLHQVTHHAAIDVVRRECRRQAREQIACEMSRLMDDNPVDWTLIEPLLDEAVQSLDETDRTAIIVRFFENKSLREVGETLGTSEDAAQKRISRALERLREHFVRHKIAAAAAGLAAVMSTHAVQAAPAGLSSTIASGSLAAAVSVPVSASLTTAKIIAMTTLQKVAVGIVLVGAAVTIIYQQHEVSQLRQQAETLTKQPGADSDVNRQMEQLKKERDSASNELAALTAENAALKNRPTEVLKLRGQVGTLQDQKTKLGETAAISKLTATSRGPAVNARPAKSRDGSMIYKQFAQQAKLDKDQADKFNDLLADHIMQDVDLVTTALHDKTSVDQMKQLFAGDNASLEKSVQDLLGDDAVGQYRDYTENLLGNISSHQFLGELTGSDSEKKDKAEKLRLALNQEAQAALANAGLPKDYQTVPILNFINIASEQQAEQSLKLLDGIYQRVAANAGSYLSPAEIASLQTFAGKVHSNNDAALKANRSLMAPIASP